MENSCLQKKTSLCPVNNGAVTKSIQWNQQAHIQWKNYHLHFQAMFLSSSYKDKLDPSFQIYPLMPLWVFWFASNPKKQNIIESWALLYSCWGMLLRTENSFNNTFTTDCCYLEVDTALDRPCVVMRRKCYCHNAYWAPSGVSVIDSRIKLTSNFPVSLQLVGWAIIQSESLWDTPPSPLNLMRTKCYCHNKKLKSLQCISNSVQAHINLTTFLLISRYLPIPMKFMTTEWYCHNTRLGSLSPSATDDSSIKTYHWLNLPQGSLNDLEMVWTPPSEVIEHKLQTIINNQIASTCIVLEQVSTRPPNKWIMIG